MIIFLVFLVLGSTVKCSNEDYLEIVDNEGSVQQCQTTDDCLLIDAKCVLGECVVTGTIECPEFMVYSECLMKCSKICQSLNGTDECSEPSTCIEGCECVDNYFWDQDKAVCISREDCEQLIDKNIQEVETIKASCPQFAIYDPCPSHCPPETCENQDVMCQSEGCAEKRCSCRAGFVQMTDDIADGCIPQDECLPAFATTPELVREEEEEGSGEELGEPVELVKPRDSRSDKCPEHSEIRECVPLEPLTCYTMDTMPAFYCGRKRCECVDGYVRADSGDEAPCVPADQCPKLI